MNIGIIDYGLSNLLSISRAVEKINGSVSLIKNPEELALVDKVILPGVGAFPQGMTQLLNSGMAESLVSFANQGKPLLGICLGMQLLLSQSEEISPTNGLNLIQGHCISLPSKSATGGSNIIPHVGWEAIHIDGNYEKLNGQYMYFVHSFYAQPSSAQHILCTSPFGELQFASGIQKDNITGFQFHPEKSGAKGLELLSIFLNN